MDETQRAPETAVAVAPAFDGQAKGPPWLPFGLGDVGLRLVEAGSWRLWEWRGTTVVPQGLTGDAADRKSAPAQQDLANGSIFLY